MQQLYCSPQATDVHGMRYTIAVHCSVCPAEEDAISLSLRLSTERDRVCVIQMMLPFTCCQARSSQSASGSFSLQPRHYYFKERLEEVEVQPLEES